MAIAHHMDRELEKRFVIVHWDQRGAGKSNHRGFDEETMRLRRCLDDARELAEHLRGRLRQDRITIPEVGVPVSFFMGAHHYNTPLALVREYADVLETPSKELVLFDHSAHLPLLAETASLMEGRSGPHGSPVLCSGRCSSRGGTLVLSDDAPREVITGAAAQLHRVHRRSDRSLRDAAKQLLGIATRAETTLPSPSPSRTPEGAGGRGERSVA